MQPNQMVIFVNNAATSRTFYGDALGFEFRELTPVFSVTALDNGSTLALLQRGDGTDDGKPVGGFELVIELTSREDVDATLTRWRSHYVTIVDDLVDQPFGYTFVGADPDGVRLRVGHFPQS